MNITTELVLKQFNWHMAELRKTDPDLTHQERIALATRQVGLDIGSAVMDTLDKYNDHIQSLINGVYGQ